MRNVSVGRNEGAAASSKHDRASASKSSRKLFFSVKKYPNPPAPEPYMIPWRLISLSVRLCVIPISPAGKGADYVEEFQSVRPSNGATNSCAAGLAAGAAGDDRRRDAIVAARRRGRDRRQLLASGHLRKPRRRADPAGMVVLDDQLLY